MSLFRLLYLGVDKTYDIAIEALTREQAIRIFQKSLIYQIDRSKLEIRFIRKENQMIVTRIEEGKYEVTLDDTENKSLKDLAVDYNDDIETRIYEAIQDAIINAT